MSNTKRNACPLLKKLRCSKIATDLLNSYKHELPIGVEFEEAVWNIRDWDRRKRNINLHFSKYTNSELLTLVKLYICQKRYSNHIRAHSAKGIFNATLALDKTIDQKSITNIASNDFYSAEMHFLKIKNKYTANRSANYLTDFNNWLFITFGMNHSFKPALSHSYAHGRFATDDQKANKLLPTECVYSIMRYANDDSLTLNDQYYFNALVLCIAGGFRLGELATLPVDCLVQLSNDNYGIRYFPEKNHSAPIEPIPPTLNESVINSIRKIISWTDEGRKLAKSHSVSKNLNWRKITINPDTLIYFLKKWCYEWTKNPEHKLVNPSITNKHSLRLSISKFEIHTMVSFNSNQRKRIKPIIEEAKILHGKGQIYPKPSVVENYERDYFMCDTPLVTDSNKGHEIILLRASEALFVLPQYKLSTANKTSRVYFNPFSDSVFIHWLNGKSNGPESTKVYEYRRSVFHRHKIIDPRTNKPLSLTVHDIRHWLNTMIDEGGASQESIRLLFARKNVHTNAVYDQTSSITRVNRIKNEIRANLTSGLTQKNYNTLLADRGSAEAESYLELKTSSMTNMSHGACTLNSHTESCKHNLGCLSQSSGPCKSLVVDPEEIETKTELDRLLIESKVMASNLNDEAPQKRHANNVMANINQLLKIKKK